MFRKFFSFLSGKTEVSKEYEEFVKKYGSNSRVFYDKDGFKIRETFMSKKAKAPQIFLITN